MLFLLYENWLFEEIFDLNFYVIMILKQYEIETHCEYQSNIWPKLKKKTSCYFKFHKNSSNVIFRKLYIQINIDVMFPAKVKMLRSHLKKKVFSSFFWFHIFFEFLITFSILIYLVSMQIYVNNFYICSDKSLRATWRYHNAKVEYVLKISKLKLQFTETIELWKMFNIL